jgi:hypothetical protein
MRFRKRPVEIEARQFNKDSANEIAKWCGGRVDRYVKPSDWHDEYISLSIPSLKER